MDRTVDLSVYSIKSNSAHGDHLTLEDLEMSHYAADDIKLTKPSSVSENAFQNLSLSLNNGGQPIKMIKPRQETRPGSSRSRIPIPVGRGTNGRSASPFFRNRFINDLFFKSKNMTSGVTGSIPAILFLF